MNKLGNLSNEDSNGNGNNNARKQLSDWIDKEKKSAARTART